jgi:excisionase family DNA binding protein
VNKIYTVNETAEILRVSTNTIWRWIKDGKLKSIKLINDKTRITENEIKRFMGDSDDK